MAAYDRFLQLLALAADIRHAPVRMAEGIVDTCPDGPVDHQDPLLTETPASDNTAERDRQAEIVLPPLAQILQADQAPFPIGEAGLVDDDPRINFSSVDGIHDPIEAHLHQVAALGEKHLQEEGGGSQPAGDGDSPA